MNRRDCTVKHSLAESFFAALWVFFASETKLILNWDFSEIDKGFHMCFNTHAEECNQLKIRIKTHILHLDWMMYSIMLVNMLVIIRTQNLRSGRVGYSSCIQ